MECTPVSFGPGVFLLQIIGRMPGVRGSVIDIASHDLCVAPSAVYKAMAAAWLRVVSKRVPLN